MPVNMTSMGKLQRMDVSSAPASTAETALTRPVSHWALHRRLYNWVLLLAHHRHSTTVLFILSFTESSFFPIPPDVLLLPLAMEKRHRAFWLATVCTLASVLGGMFGYLIGWGLWALVQDFCFMYMFSKAQFDTVTDLYKNWDFWVVFAAGFTPLPYKLFTIAGGVSHISFPMMVLASLIGRGARFFLVASLMWKFGAPVKRFIDRYFNWLSLLFVVLLAGGFACIKLMH